MNDHEINRAVQYVTASTCYGRETVATILKTGFGELTDLAVQSTRRLDEVYEELSPTPPEPPGPARQDDEGGEPV
jgi:tRNA(Phe) wybutosine-synthesizing methylase Tyw3